MYDTISEGALVAVASDISVSLELYFTFTSLAARFLIPLTLLF